MGSRHLCDLGVERVNCSDYAVYVEHLSFGKSCLMVRVLD